MAFFGKLQSVLHGQGLRNHLHFHGPLSRVGDGGVGFEDAGVGISEVWVETGAGFSFNETFTHWSHPESPHELVAVESLLSIDKIDLFFFIPPEPVHVRHQSKVVDVV